MSDEKNVFDFHGLSDDEELDKLLESVRRDIGESSPEPERSARTQPRREAPAAREPVQAAAPSAAGRRAAEPRAQQLRQQRPTAQRAGGAGSDFVRNVQLGAIANIVDYVFLMGYDMHGPWDGYADLNAPLYTPDDGSPQYTLSVQEAVNRYLTSGVSASKLVLGMPFYGYRYQVTESWNNGLYSPFTASRSVSYDTVVSQYLNVYTRFFHSTAQVPYLFNGSWFITYDDPDSIAAKTRYAKSLGLAGVGAWELSQDKSARLLSSAYRALMGG